MSLLELIESQKAHAARFSSENGMAGERIFLNTQASWVKRPKGKEMKNLLAALKQVEGIEIKASSFDFVHIPEGVTVDFSDAISLLDVIKSLTFIELKTSNQKKVTTPDFRNFFFAITQNEMTAAELLGERHKVVLYNKITEDILVTSVGELLNRASSQNWQLSINLGPGNI